MPGSAIPTAAGTFWPGHLIRCSRQSWPIHWPGKLRRRYSAGHNIESPADKVQQLAEKGPCSSACRGSLCREDRAGRAKSKGQWERGPNIELSCSMPARKGRKIHASSGNLFRSSGCCPRASEGSRCAAGLPKRRLSIDRTRAQVKREALRGHHLWLEGVFGPWTKAPYTTTNAPNAPALPSLGHCFSDLRPQASQTGSAQQSIRSRPGSPKAQHRP